ncbi:deoxyribodipyrimidine photo-lyase [Thermus sp. NEB1569]|uniref:deoxyribodipyrimidine photo-lyase n=1 Tax=Thermus sp. NEB1569 TaxID=2918899 RepID=UPI001EFBF21C|nr:deoxyribodipyrimidine photo-lyase [Thermus sp. NEB1569]ULR39934.1 deoxyribodipyrimidine photo-lyase [Thermus sp. NEB1569]
MGGAWVNLVWHRADLRLADHPALLEAAKGGRAVGLVVLDPNNLRTSPRRRAWFLENVRALREAYRARGGALWVLEGLPWEEVPEAARRLKARAVYALAGYTPYGRYRDLRVREALPVPLYLLPAPHLVPPDLPRAYRVYTPFARRFQGVGTPLPAPEALPREEEEGKVPRVLSDIPLPEPGEEAARAKLGAFLETKLARYAEERDRLDGEGGSRLSPYFTLGVLSPREAAFRALALGGEGARKWVSELLWRDFSYHLLYHFPHMAERALEGRLEALPWQEEDLFQAWYWGKTGVPLVDAAMRELHATGFLSNRARMVTAQFAVKYLLLPWRRAEGAFRHLLLDGDRAVNLQGWQWAGGLGVDAAPYFRLFNPVLQGERHDPGRRWLRRWAPEYPSYAPQDPVVDLEAARRRYLSLAGDLLGKDPPAAPPSP